MKGIDNIKRSAAELGACRKLDPVEYVGDAIALLMTPQGREFALKTGFPDLQVWRANREAARDAIGVYLDTHNVFASNHDVVAVGDSVVSLEVSGTQRLYHVLAMHGAQVEINASDYAVVTITNIGATVRIHNDGTAKVTVEQSEKGGTK